MRIIQITTLYPARDPKRRDEYNQCLEINCNSCIDRIIVLYQGDDCICYPSLSHSKITLVNIDCRPTYQDMIDYANQHVSPDDVVIFGNADIYFDEDSNVHRAKEIKPGELWALCRYEWVPQKRQWRLFCESWAGTFDSYIFRPPLKKFDASFLVGPFGCDTCFVFKACLAGLTACAPSLSIHSKHLHTSAERNPVQPNYIGRWDFGLILHPCTIESNQHTRLSLFRRTLHTVRLFILSSVIGYSIGRDYTVKRRVKELLHIGQTNFCISDKPKFPLSKS